MSPELDLLKGTLDVLVLKALTWEPRHGYAVAKWIMHSCQDAIFVEDAALYTALHRMEKRGWVRSQWGLSENNRKARYYELTAAGRKQLRTQHTGWMRYAEAITTVLNAPA